jgi:hypothetical protein
MIEVLERHQDVRIVVACCGKTAVGMSEHLPETRPGAQRSDARSVVDYTVLGEQFNDLVVEPVVDAVRVAVDEIDDLVLIDQLPNRGLDVTVHELSWVRRAILGCFWDARGGRSGAAKAQAVDLRLCVGAASVYPAWNCRDRRVLRFWSSDAGYDSDVIEALRARHFDQLQIVAPSQAEFAAQLQTELDLCQQHLKDVLDQYWDAGWRRDHKGFGIYPEDHLWRAAAAVREIEAALDQCRRAMP